MDNGIYHHRLDICAAQCNAQCELPAAQLAQQLFEAATEHADLLGCGYKDLQTTGMAWVLSRLAIEVDRMPGVGEQLRLTTWVENFNRHFSQRNFRIAVARVGADGEDEEVVIGYARTIWVAIDWQTRRPAMLDRFTGLAECTHPELPCPIAPPAKLREDAGVETEERTYTFRTCDIDLNRHVNSARYIELMLNSLPLETYDRYGMRRFDIEFKREAHFGETATIAHGASEAEGTLTMDCAIRVDETLRTISRTRLVLRERVEMADCFEES